MSEGTSSLAAEGDPSHVTDRPDPSADQMRQMIREELAAALTPMLTSSAPSASTLTIPSVSPPQ